MYSCGKHREKRRNCLLHAISPFLTMLSTLYGTYFPFEMHFKMSSAICLNLDQCKVLSSGNGLNIIKMSIINPWKEIGRVLDLTSDFLFSSPSPVFTYHFFEHS